MSDGRQPAQHATGQQPSTAAATIVAMTDALESFKVHDIQELKRQNRRPEALRMLQDVARQVQPVLRKRMWTVPKLREFFPKNPSLLVCRTSRAPPNTNQSSRCCYCDPDVLQVTVSDSCSFMLG